MFSNLGLKSTSTIYYRLLKKELLILYFPISSGISVSFKYSNSNEANSFGSCSNCLLKLFILLPKSTLVFGNTLLNFLILSILAKCVF